MNTIPTSTLTTINGSSFLIPQDAHTGNSEFKVSDLNAYTAGRFEDEHIWDVYKAELPLIGTALALSKDVDGEKFIHYIPLAQVSSIFIQQ